MKWQEFFALSERLQHRAEWTPELIYVHRTRLVIGVLLGIGLGLSLGAILWR